MNKLLLQEMICHETEDYSTDECLLEVRTDGVLQLPLRREMKKNHRWSLGQEYLFHETAQIKLWDEDSPDANDLLGTVNIDANPVQGGTATFTLDDAYYDLIYSVEESPVDPVEEAISNFENSTHLGVWPGIDKTQLLTEIRARIANPLLVDQCGTAFCGPAAIVFEFVSRYPERYVRTCQALFETGRFEARTKTVKPSDTLLCSHVPAGMAHVDWLLMAALRDVENEIFDVEGGAGDFIEGLTTPWEMKGWAKEILNFGDVEYESLYVYGEFDAMRRAQSVYNKGGVAFLMIHDAMLGNDEPAISFPNHWVAFQGELTINGEDPWSHESGRIRFNCYSWGAIQTVEKDEETFEDHIWGIVYGE